MAEAGARGPERTRQRLLDEACRLFALYSFAGTSLQMIADTLGVTKAAIYHHFKTRDEILTAVIHPAIADLRSMIATAEAQKTPNARADVMLQGFVDLTVKHRRLIGMIGTDPGVTSALRAHDDIIDLLRKPAHLLGLDDSPAAEVSAIVILAGIAGAASSPDLAHLGDEELRQHLLAVGRRGLGLRVRRT
ncbi:MAG: TetR/AcrR family transcriptional regulator [Hamadaea sp.]|nr:TetR/AcrR family transcriptional regulator [Hamadaea sp.]